MVQRTLDQAERMGAPRAEALCLSFGGALNFRYGHWSIAENELRRSEELYHELGSASGESITMQRLGVLLTAMGRLDEGWEVLNDALAIGERATMRSHVLTRLYASMARNRLAAGDVEAAAKCMEEGAIVAERHGACVTCNALLLPEAVRVALAVGDTEGAEARVVELEQLADEYGSAAWVGMANHARARLSASRGEHRKAASHFASAERAFREGGAVYDAARSLAGRLESLRADAADDTTLGPLGERLDQALHDLPAPTLES